MEYRCSIVAAVITAAFLSVVTASPAAYRHPNVEVRQTFSCTSNDECYPAELSNTSVPIRLIECVSNVCFCDDCFSQDDNGRCAIENECYYYDIQTATCVDERRSQITAFALSLTLSGVGAANLYIERYDLAVPQLLLFIFVFVFPCCMICLPLCFACCADKEWSLILLCPLICGVLLLICAILAMWAWWIADAVIFGLNQRTAGDGCALNNNL